MGSVDDRIVSISFDNKAFESRISETLSSLDKLKQSLDFSQASKSFDDISKSAEGFDISSMGDAVQNISDKFSTLGAIGFSVIQSLTQSAVEFATNLSGQILDPLLVGGKTRATNIENAKFQFKGLGIDVNQAMGSALAAVKGTAFGLDEAAKAAAQFGASGVDAGHDMQQALRGIAGSAAITNTSFAEIADIFTSVAGTGKLTNQDLNRFAIRGLNATATLAKGLGKTQEEIHEMAREGQIDFATFSKVMDDAFGAHAQEANQTYTGSLANMHAAFARLGASFFGPEMEQQKNLFNALTPVIDNVAAALGPLISEFINIRGVGVNSLIDLLKGFDSVKSGLSASVSNIAKAVDNVFQAFTQQKIMIGQAFKEVFPKDFNGAAVLIHLTAVIRRFTETLKLGGDTGEKFKNLYRGVFAALSIGIEVVKETVRFFAGLVKSVKDLSGVSSGGILDFFSNLATSLVKLNDKLVTKGGIKDFFDSIIPTIATFKASIQGFFDDFSTDKLGAVGDATGRLSERFGFLGTVFHALVEAMQFVIDHLDSIKTAVVTALGVIVAPFAGFGKAIADSMKTGNFDEVFDIINTGLIGGILFLIHKLLNSGLGELGGGLVDKINDAFDTLTGTLKAMQTEIKADTLIKIAKALAILTASLLVLSLIDSAALTKALLAMSVGFGELVGVMALLDKIAGGVGSSTSITILAVGMIALAGAILILSAAVAVLSNLSLGELTKGLVGVGVLLGVITVAVRFLPDSAGMISAGVGMAALAVGIRILANAVQAFSTMSWGEIAKGLTAVAISLGVLATASKFIDASGMVAAGVAMIPLAIGLNILAGAVAIFGTMDIPTLVQGLIGVGASLAVVATAMGLMPLDLPITAAGLVLVGIALNSIGVAMKIFASMDFGEMARGMAALAGTLVLLAVGTEAMSGTALGSASILLAATGLAVLAGVLKNIAKLKWGEIGKGLATIAAALAILAVGGIAVDAAVPGLLGLGAALLLVGGGFALFGIGVAGVANGLKLIADTGSTAIDALIQIFDAVILKLPDLATALGEGLVNIAKTLLDALPEMTANLGDVFIALLQAIDKAIPEVGKTFEALIDTMLVVVSDKAPDFIQAGFDLLLKFLQGIRDNISQMTTTVADIIIDFLNALTEKAPEIVQAGLDLLTAFLKGIADNIGQVVTAGLSIITSIIQGISDGINGDGTDANPGILGAATDAITTFIKGIADSALDIIQAGKDALLKFAEGLATNTIDFINKCGDVLVNFINNLAAAIRTHNSELRDAGKNIAGAILSGITFGLSDKLGTVVDGAKNVAKSVIGGAAKVLHLGGPSKEFIKIGNYVAEGLAIGMRQQKFTEKAAQDLSDNVILAFNDAFSTMDKVAKALQSGKFFQPVLTPVVDLSEVRKSQNIIDKMIGSNKIVAGVSFNQATELAHATGEVIARGTAQDNNGLGENNGVLKGVDSIKFEQTINSPTALNSGEIYRQTKAQLAMAKKELKLV